MLLKFTSLVVIKGFPPKFCEENLPTYELRMVLEDEKGSEHRVKYISARGGIGGGWKAFASGHNLEIGDALIFELTEPTKFKVCLKPAFLSFVFHKGYFDY